MSINLEKGQKINLAKADGTALKEVFMGLGWDAAGGLFSLGGGSIDLDASCIMLDENKNIVDTVWYGHLKSNDNSIKHSGDNLTGAGDGDDEVIKVKLDEVPANVKYLAFTINSFRGQTFDKVKNCFARLVDASTNTEFCKYTLSEKGDHTAKLMATVYRHNGVWKVNAQGIPMNGKTVNIIAESVKTHL